MFGKLRRARRAEVAAAMPARETTGTRPTASPIPAAFYMRARTHHTIKKATITRLHVEHATLARMNNAAPVSRPRVPDSQPIARAAAIAPGLSTVVLPPALRDAPAMPVRQPESVKGDARWGSSRMS